MSTMLILSEIHNSTCLFDLYEKKQFLQTLAVNEKNIVTTEFLPRFKDKRLTIVLHREGSHVHFEAAKAVLVNGVACRRRKLKAGDTLMLGPYRLVFKGEQKDTEPVAPPPLKVGTKDTKTKKIFSPRHVFEAAVLLISLSFLWYCTTQWPIQRSPQIQPSAATAAHEAPPPANERREEKVVPKPTPKKAPAVPLLTFAPGAVPPPVKLDMLFVHAHPDDETLDYGLYISKAVEKGKKVGVLTFTDGESGFDFYPDRDTTGMYPDKELHGKQLARVRVEEEEKALTALGASVYIRLGLRNRPYTAQEAKKSIPTIIKEWGGDDALIGKLTALFADFDPAVIVSPDGPSKAREHFEHKAVGYITAKAVTAYRKEHPGKLQAYLKLVDVQQAKAYPHTKLRTIGRSPDVTDIVHKKKIALLQYETQADACYYGIKRLENFPFEYYFIVFQKSSTSAALLLDPESIKLSSNS